MDTIYTVTCGRPGFENQQSFQNLGEAERFFESEAEEIGSPVSLIEQDCHAIRVLRIKHQD